MLEAIYQENIGTKLKYKFHLWDNRIFPEIPDFNTLVERWDQSGIYSLITEVK